MIASTISYTVSLLLQISNFSHILLKNAETIASKFISDHVERCVVKSKSAQNSLVEINMEVRLKDGNTDFINELSAITGVNSAALVSFNGEYMG